MMLNALLATTLVLAPLQEPKAAPSLTRVKSALVGLDAAFKSDDTNARIAAIKSSVRVLDAVVIDRMAQLGLNDRSIQVKLTTIEALRWMDHSMSVDSLEAHFRGHEKAIKKDQRLLLAILKSLGHLGRESSLPLLTEDPFSVREPEILRARILGLGNIHSRASVEALFDLMKLVGPDKIQNRMDDFRTALKRLTGEDRGNGAMSWSEWWQQNRREFELPEKPADLEPARQRAWDRYWGWDKVYAKQKAKEQQKQKMKEKRKGGR